MSKQDDMPGNGKPDWDELVNALIDGELGPAEAQQLQQAARSDERLAAAIIEAYELQQALAALPSEAAPASLRRKLQQVPRLQQAARRADEQPAQSWLPRPGWWQPRWVMALAVLPLVVALTLIQLGPREPSAAEVAQARQDLALALAYLQKASRTTEREIHMAFDEGIGQPVQHATVRTLGEQFDLDKEQDT
jgi:anti-sigma-K factor RskA